MGIKIGIDPSETSTTAIAVFEKNILLDKQEVKNKDWKNHSKFIIIVDCTQKSK